MIHLSYILFLLLALLSLDAQMGYGSRAIDLLTKYYEGGLFSGTGGEEGSEDGSEESSEDESEGEDDDDDDDESSDEEEEGNGE